MNAKKLKKTLILFYKSSPKYRDSHIYTIKVSDFVVSKVAVFISNPETVSNIHLPGVLCTFLPTPFIPIEVMAVSAFKHCQKISNNRHGCWLNVTANS